MSLLSTLAKVAVGVAVAKGVSSMARNRGAGGASAGGGTGSVFGGAQSAGGTSGGGLGDLLRGGGLGDMLKNSGAGGLGGLLSGQSTGSGANTGGGIGGILEGLSKASRPGSGAVAQPSGGSFGDMFNQSLDRFGEPETPPTPEHEDSARIFLRAMLQAAKSDGRIDDKEKQNLMGHLGDISKEDMAYVNEVLESPVDAKALAREVPDHMAHQVYSMSLLAIDLDSKEEAQYLHDLAQALNIEPRDADAIHDQMGEPKLYS